VPPIMCGRRGQRAPRCLPRSRRARARTPSSLPSRGAGGGISGRNRALVRGAGVRSSPEDSGGGPPQTARQQ